MGAPRREKGPLADVLARLDVLVNWERRDRSATALQSMRVDVESARDLCARLGAWPPPAPAPLVVHVAGSKGKGSTCAWVDAALRGHGLRTGRYTSPHVESLTERVVIDGQRVAPDDLASALARALDTRDAGIAADATGPAARSTWFDVLTAAAFSLFAERRLDAWVVECGLGGRLDSTNVVRGDVAVITSIELEHTAILGSTREAIAREKAGIFKRGARAVVGLAPPGAPSGRPDVGDGEDPASRAIAEVARAVDVDVTWVAPRGGLALDARNRELARVVLEELGKAAPDSGLDARALDALPRDAGRLPGRWERLTVRGTPVVLDGAHVATSLAWLLEELARDPALGGPPVVVFGVGRDKDADALLKCLVGRVDRVLCSSAGAGPYLAADLLAEKARTIGLVAETVPDPRMAVQRALQADPRRWVLVTGSLHLVGAVRGDLVEMAASGTPC